MPLLSSIQSVTYINYYFIKSKTTFLEPVRLIGEGEYNLNDLKETATTHSFDGLDEMDKHCQNEESINDCSTRHYTDELLRECGCLPFQIRQDEKVI